MLVEVAQRLPPEMQVLDVILRLLSRGERMGVLKEATSGQSSSNGPPQCDIKRIQAAATQLVTDMEEKEAIPDRCLAL